MEYQKTNQDVMTPFFSTIKADAYLKEAFEGIKENLEGSPRRRPRPHPPDADRGLPKAD